MIPVSIKSLVLREISSTSQGHRLDLLLPETGNSLIAGTASLIRLGSPPNVGPMCYLSAGEPPRGMFLVSPS